MGKLVDSGQKVASLGGMAGAVVDPVKGPEGGTPRYGAPIAEVASRRMSQDPRAMVAQLNEGMSALKQASDRTQRMLMPFYMAARDNLIKTIG
jgi:hypothetical protein